MGDPGTLSVSEAVVNSSGDCGTRGSRSSFGIPRDVATGVAAASFWSVSVGLGSLVVSIGGGGRPSHLRSRSLIVS